MDEMVRARYLGGMEVDVVLPDGTQLTCQPRHIYEVPESMVKDHPEWRVQAPKEDDEVPKDEPKDEPKEVHTQARVETAVEDVLEHKGEPRERAVDRGPKEVG